MRIVHTSPADAYDMSVVLEAKVVYPIHYGSAIMAPFHWASAPNKTTELPSGMLGGAITS
jgi:L-ascorbate metabolism protein UlaG (beta-lactamase superfamily)